MKAFQPTVMKDADAEIAVNAETSAPKIVEELIHQAERAAASDIHLQMEHDGAVVSFRLDGMMTPATKYSIDIAERVFGRIKFLARLKTYQESMPQDGRIEQRAVNGQSDIRVATYPTVTGEKIVLRLFNPLAAKGIAELEFPEDAAAELENFLRQPAGMLLLTGPAGSGKTTTIYGCLRCLAESGGRHIITIEDPVEQIVPGVMQTEVNEARGLDFAKAARHLLRQDPQAFVIGEIRDEETANIAVRAALTGHLVISTLHAGSCKGVLERLLVMCADHSAIAAAVELVLNQRLLRKVCLQCGGKGIAMERSPLPGPLPTAWGEGIDKGRAGSVETRRGMGCGACLQTGYQGRVPLVEWLRADDVLRGQIRAHELKDVAPQRTLEESARILVQKGITNEPEYRRVFGL